MAGPLKEQSIPDETQLPLNVAATRPIQNRTFVFGAAFIIFLFVAFIGYLVYGSARDRVHRWDTEDYAPRKENKLLSEHKETLMAQIGNAKEATQSNSIGEVASQEKEQTPESAAEPMKNEENTEAEKQISSLPSGQSAGITNADSSIIYFEHSSNEIPQEAYKTLNNIVKFTAQRRDLKITVIGFTDSIGNPVFNKHLSKYRADMVKNYLIGQGISPENIEAIGKGPQNPLGSNKTSEGRQMNRRVEIKLNYR